MRRVSSTRLCPPATTISAFFGHLSRHGDVGEHEPLFEQQLLGGAILAAMAPQLQQMAHSVGWMSSRSNLDELQWGSAHFVVWQLLQCVSISFDFCLNKPCNNSHF